MLLRNPIETREAAVGRLDHVRHPNFWEDDHVTTLERALQQAKKIVLGSREKVWFSLVRRNGMFGARGLG